MKLIESRNFRQNFDPFSKYETSKMIHLRILLPNPLYSVQDYSLDETITSMLDQLQTEGQCCGMADWSEFNSPSVKG